MPICNTLAMNHHLSEISSQVAADAHAVVILDGAGWHRSQGLVVPGNITLLELPPYSPELNPVERVWHYLRSHWLANSVFHSLADIMDACEMAWNRFAGDHPLIRSLCAVAWAPARVSPPLSIRFVTIFENKRLTNMPGAGVSDPLHGDGRRR
jgi:DDE superfamily endonuclease